ncbi:MAG: aspartate aminotransferase family protein [Acidobacteriaceae bacterium]
MEFQPQDETADSIISRDNEYLLPVYSRYAVAMERGEGVYLYDTDGRRYLDLMAGLGVNALGHAHPRMVATFADQAAKVVHLSPQYSNRYPSKLAEKLCSLTQNAAGSGSGMGGVFYSTGGSEAVEGALKLARSVAHKNYGPNKYGIVSLLGSYHGRTYGSLSVTGQAKYRDDFEPGLPGAQFVQRNNIADLRAVVNDSTCAILIETMLGEGGVFECTKEFLAEARRLADAHHALLIFDEIQCGLGRTGRWFAYEEHGVEPDVLILGKPLGGGIPLSAILVKKALFHGFGLAKHGSTLGGSPLACRLGLEFLSVVEDENLLQQVRDTGAYLRQGLLALVEEHNFAVEARGQGLIQGLELRGPGRPLAEAALEQGVMLNCIQGNVIRFLPSFLLKREHVDVAMEVLGKLLRQASTASPATAAQPVVVGSV